MTAAREEAQARPGSRRVENIPPLFIHFIPVPQTSGIPQSNNLPPFLSSMVYAFVFDGPTFTLMVGSAEKGARTFSLRECAPQDWPCPFPRNVGGWAVVWGFKCSHFLFSFCSSVSIHRRTLYKVRYCL